MRKVQVQKWIQVEEAGVWKNKLMPSYEGSFHQFAQEADGEGQTNPVAIVERDDGTIDSVYCQHVQFLDRIAAA